MKSQNRNQYLSCYREDKLSISEKKEMEKHLEECPDCQNYFEKYHKEDRDGKALPPLEKDLKEKGHSREFSSPWPLVLTGAAAGFVLTLIVLWTLVVKRDQREIRQKSREIDRLQKEINESQKQVTYLARALASRPPSSRYDGGEGKEEKLARHLFRETFPEFPRPKKKSSLQKEKKGAKERIHGWLELLAHKKHSSLAESQIRAYGSQALPQLSQFALSSRGKSHSARLRAVHLLSDMGGWGERDVFIALLEEDSPQIRVWAAQALKRITGRDLGYSLSFWRKGENLERGIKKWKEWEREKKSPPGPPKSKEWEREKKSPPGPPKSKKFQDQKGERKKNQK